MDTLHPVAANEQWLAQGEYNYQVAGKDSGLKENWSLHKGAGGEMIHRAKVGGFIAGTHLRQVSHLVMLADFQPVALEMSQDINGQLAHTRLDCAPTGIRQTITTENYEANAGENTTIETEISAPEGYKLFFPPVSAQGLIAQSYNFTAGGKQTLHLVSVRIQPQDALPLSLETQTLAYEYIDKHDVETPAGQFCCRHFIRYDQHMRQDLWLDEHWITVQWSVPYTEIMKWEYLLTRYQRN
jgi:hypothetical protein